MHNKNTTQVVCVAEFWAFEGKTAELIYAGIDNILIANEICGDFSSHFRLKISATSGYI